MAIASMIKQIESDINATVEVFQHFSPQSSFLQIYDTFDFILDIHHENMSVLNLSELISWTFSMISGEQSLASYERNGIAIYGTTGNDMTIRGLHCLRTRANPLNFLLTRTWRRSKWWKLLTFYLYVDLKQRALPICV